VGDTFRPEIAAEQIKKIVGWLTVGPIPKIWTRAGLLEELASVTYELSEWSMRQTEEGKAHG
jgi:hypothetical protein